MFRVPRDGPSIAPAPPRTERPRAEPRSAALVRLARLFASADDAVSSGHYDELQDTIGRISAALGQARRAHKNAPAARLEEGALHLSLAPSRPHR